MDRTRELGAATPGLAKTVAPKKGASFKAAFVAAQEAARPVAVAATTGRPNAPGQAAGRPDTAAAPQPAARPDVALPPAAIRPTPAAPAAAAAPSVAALAAGTGIASAAAPAGRGTEPVPPAADRAFRQRIAAMESSATATRPGYGAVNAASGALGRYQLMSVALRDVGWQDAAGGWTGTAARQGVTSDAEFLGNPSAQEAAMDAYLRRSAQLLQQNGALGHAGATVPGLEGATVPVSEAGLLAAAHRRGAHSVARYLNHRTETPDAPLNGSDQRAFAQVERRLREFSDLPLPQIARLPGRGRNAA